MLLPLLLLLLFLPLLLLVLLRSPYILILLCRNALALALADAHDSRSYFHVGLLTLWVWVSGLEVLVLLLPPVCL